MHLLNEYVAEECGVMAALIFHHFAFWIQKNHADGKHFYDGKWWTYVTTSGLQEIFFYMSVSQIKTAVKKLTDAGLVISGDYNQNRFNRMKWYSITEKGWSLYSKQKSTIRDDVKSPLLERSNNTSRVAKNRQCNNINNNICNTLIDKDKGLIDKGIDKDILCISAGNARNPSTEELDEFFKSLWKLYPKKKGLGNVSRTQKLKLFRRGYDEISRCIERYKVFLEDTYSDAERDKFTKNGSTFFNSGYMDYLDENYNSQDTPAGDENSAEGLEPWERPDWQGGWVWVTSEDGLTERVFKPKPFNGEL